MNTFTKLLFRGVFATIFTLSLSVSAFAQEEEEEDAPLSISGSIDTYVRTAPGYEGVAPGTSFANGNGFSMGMLDLIISKEVGDVGFVGNVVFGPRGKEAAFGAPFGGQIVNQLYGYWNVSDKVKLTMGAFNTFLGYEVISPTANFNYSTSYMFSWGPFNQAGLKADFALSDNFSLMLAVMNPTDVLETNTFGNQLTAGLQLGYSGDFGSIYLNSRYGDYSGKLFQGDLTAGFDLSDAFFLGVNATILDDDGAGFSGVALYPQVSVSDNFSLGLRGEYFAINGGYIDLSGGTAGVPVGPIGYDTNGDGSVIDLTLSANISVGKLTFIPEVRIDATSEDTYVNKDGEVGKSLPSLLFAAIYSF
jgi:hypothetical protein